MSNPTSGRVLSPGDPCPVCGPVGRVRRDPDGHLSCSNCLWNTEDDAQGRVYSPRRCHIDDCEQVARYGAKLDWTNQPTVLLCEEHAVTERQLHSVIEIRNECSWHPGEYHGICSEAVR